jgi:hypothetical protein
MFKRLSDWRARLKACLIDRIDLGPENLALRHQVMVSERSRRLRGRDRLGWCLLARVWPRWREVAGCQNYIRHYGVAQAVAEQEGG